MQAVDVLGDHRVEDAGRLALGPVSGSGQRDTRLIRGDEFCEHGWVVRRDGFSFSTEVKVRFAETDAQGIVHNSNYFIWFEVARVEYLERYAGGDTRVRKLGVAALRVGTDM